VCPLNDHLQTQCKELYQLHHEISIDERIVRSKAQFSFCQYNYTQQNQDSSYGAYMILTVGTLHAFLCTMERMEVDLRMD